MQLIAAGATHKFGVVFSGFWGPKSRQPEFPPTEFSVFFGKRTCKAPKKCRSRRFKDSFLRMNSIATVLYSPYAIWFPLYIATAYAGLPFLVVSWRKKQKIPGHNDGSEYNNTSRTLCRILPGNM